MESFAIHSSYPGRTSRANRQRTGVRERIYYSGVDLVVNRREGRPSPNMREMPLRAAKLDKRSLDRRGLAELDTRHNWLPHPVCNPPLHGGTVLKMTSAESRQT